MGENERGVLAKGLGRQPPREVSVLVKLEGEAAVNLPTGEGESRCRIWDGLYLRVRAERRGLAHPRPAACSFTLSRDEAGGDLDLLFRA